MVLKLTLVIYWYIFWYQEIYTYRCEVPWYQCKMMIQLPFHFPKHIKSFHTFFSLSVIGCIKKFLWITYLFYPWGIVHRHWKSDMRIHFQMSFQLISLPGKCINLLYHAILPSSIGPTDHPLTIFCIRLHNIYFAHL